MKVWVVINSSQRALHLLRTQDPLRLTHAQILHASFANKYFGLGVLFIRQYAWSTCTYRGAPHRVSETATGHFTGRCTVKALGVLLASHPVTVPGNQPVTDASSVVTVDGFHFPLFFCPKEISIICANRQ